MEKILEEIEAERKRQIEKEGWSIEHDDGHTDESLVMAAACYLAPERLFIQLNHQYGEVSFRDPWPWVGYSRGAECRSHTDWHKEGKDRRKQIIQGIALAVAELERLDRQESKPERTG